MRAIVLTSNLRRHNYVANTIAARMDVLRVWQEEKSFAPLTYAQSPEEELVIARHFAARDASEEAYFAGHRQVEAPTRLVKPGGCNDPAELADMHRAKPDVVLV